MRGMYLCKDWRGGGVGIGDISAKKPKKIAGLQHVAYFSAGCKSR